jgi:hypothetical protein
MRRLLAAVGAVGAVLAMTGVAGSVQAAPVKSIETIQEQSAARACSVTKTIGLTATAPDGSWASVTVRTVDCGTYQRWQYFDFPMDTPVVDGLSGSSSYGRPSAYLRATGPNGPVCAAYDPTYIPAHTYVAGNNAACTEPVWITLDGTMDKPLPYTFFRSRQIPS